MTSSRRNVKPSFTELWDSGQISKEHIASALTSSNSLHYVKPWLLKISTLSKLCTTSKSVVLLAWLHSNWKPHPVAECIHALLKSATVFHWLVTFLSFVNKNFVTNNPISFWLTSKGNDIKDMAPPSKGDYLIFCFTFHDPHIEAPWTNATIMYLIFFDNHDIVNDYTFRRLLEKGPCCNNIHGAWLWTTFFRGWENAYTYFLSKCFLFSNPKW